MATLEIHPDVMPFLCKKAKEEGKSVTDILDEILRSVRDNPSSGNGELYTCHNCKTEVDIVVNDNKGYCEQCECVVFVDKA